MPVSTILQWRKMKVDETQSPEGGRGGKDLRRPCYQKMADGHLDLNRLRFLHKKLVTYSDCTLNSCPSCNQLEVIAPAPAQS